MHGISAIAMAMAILRCQWRHHCVVVLGKCLLDFVQQISVAKGDKAHSKSRPKNAQNSESCSENDLFTPRVFLCAPCFSWGGGGDHDILKAI